MGGKNNPPPSVISIVHQQKVLSQGRRYGIAAVLATQTLEYFDSTLQAILDQVGTHITFAVGRRDAEKLAPFYAKDPPPELKFEQIYEREIIKSTKEVVTWEPPEAEQQFNQVDEELTALQAEFQEFELINSRFAHFLGELIGFIPHFGTKNAAKTIYIPHIVKISWTR